MTAAGVTERMLSAAVKFNNGRMRAATGARQNPIPLDGVSWNTDLEAAWPVVRAEWDAFESTGGRLPRIEDLLGEDQGNEGPWRAGLMVANGRPVAPMSVRFPSTVAALLAVPGLRSALWSKLDPGTEIPEHSGPDAGVLRYHLGVLCGEGAALRVGSTVVQYRDGRGVLFDDTAPHAAWNRGTAPRVTIFCELYPPAPRAAHVLNRAVHATMSLDPRYRRAPERAAEWDRALNH